MARPRRFDYDHALDKAMRLFWERGYHDASVDDLVQSTGMNRHSLYALFGGKRELFLESLRRYWWTVAWERMDGLVAREPALAEIGDYFERLAGPAKQDESRLGCLFWSVATQIAPRDPEVAGMIRAASGFLTDRFEVALANARRKGEVYAGLNVRRAAWLLTVQAQGMSGLARAGERSGLQNCRDAVLESFSLKLKPDFWGLG